MAENKDKFEFDKFRIISTRRLSNTMAEGRKNGERFCFILGSGASFNSGIPVGTMLEKAWMDDMSKTPGFDEVCSNAAELRASGKLDYDFEKDILPKWKNGEKLSSEYYFDIYTLRFFPNHRNGYFYFEKLISKAKPSFGYNALAQIISDEMGSNLVITTNFDSLVEDALFIYTDKKPLVINHELLADYAEDPNVKRPIIAKIHRGLFFDPLNRKEDTKKLKGNWAEVLKSIFHVYTPVVIGYGGGDQSLMDLLEEKDVKMKNGIYWCNYEDDGLPSERILKLITDKNGWLVNSKGFDAVMLILGKELAEEKILPPNVRTHLEKQFKDRVSGYEQQYTKLMEKIFGKDKSEKTKPETDSEREFKEEAKELDKRVEEIQNKKPENELTAWDYFSKGNRAYDENEYDKAIEYYNKAIELDPDYAKAYNNRGAAYGEKGEYDKEIEDYSKAIELNPDDAITYYNRGIAYRKKGEYAKAIESSSKAIELNPDYADAYYNRGVVYGEKGEYAKAIEDYSKAIELNPDYADAYNNRGNDYHKKGEYDKAIEDYNKAIKLNPDLAVAYNNRGVVYGEKGEYAKAIEDYSKAIELNPDYADAYNNRGNAYHKKGEYDKAIEDYNKAIKLNPDLAVAYNNRGSAYAIKKEYDKAIEDFDKAIKLDPNYKYSYLYRSLVCEALGETEKAEADRKMYEKLKAEQGDSPDSDDYSFIFLNNHFAY